MENLSVQSLATCFLLVLVSLTGCSGHDRRSVNQPTQARRASPSTSHNRKGQVPANIPPTQVRRTPKTLGDAANNQVDSLERLARTIEDEPRIQVSQDQGVDLTLLSCASLTARAAQFKAIYERNLRIGDTARARQANKLERQVRSQIYTKRC